MNEVARSIAPAAAARRRPAVAPARAAARTPAGTASDREFLAPVLEILETPASPVRVAFLWTICVAVAVALGLAWFGRIDVVATAQGKFEPTGRVKVIEPVETGRVAAIHVVNDSQVKAGDVLVELDPSAANADVNEARANLASAEAESVRRDAALAAARAGDFAPPAAIAWPGDITPELRVREERVLAADLGQISATVASFEAQKAQKTAERDMLEATIANQQRLVATLQERVDMRAKLLASQSGAKSAVIDATETLQYQQTQLALQEGQLASAATGLDVVARDAEKAVQSFLSDEAEKLEAAERQAEESRQRLAKAQALVDHLTLRAPIDGRVQSSVVTNIGQVVTSGQEVMRIVPQGSRLEIEAYVLNRDIGFVHVGQPAVIKVESFPFTRYGSIKAKVVRIAQDAIPAPDASAIEGDPARASNAAGFAGGERVQNLVFAVELEPEAATIQVDGAERPLTSGMAATVEIKTGSRRLIDYVFSPLVEVASRAMRER